jgi:hypothetical protein
LAPINVHALEDSPKLEVVRNVVSKAQAIVLFTFMLPLRTRFDEEFVGVMIITPSVAPSSMNDEKSFR